MYVGGGACLEALDMPTPSSLTLLFWRNGSYCSALDYAGLYELYEVCVLTYEIMLDVPREVTRRGLGREISH